MKASAPEKIYINDFGSELSYDWHIEHCCESDIEYVRKDAFIEKACEWFRKIDYDDSMPPFETTEEFIEGFKKAMKGE